MSKTSRLGIRTKHHTILLAITCVLLLVFVVSVPGDDRMYLWSMATGYVSIILLAVTLLIGPINIYAKKHNPLSSDLRRDAGIWCGLVGLAHIVIGIQVHMGNIWLYFFKAIEGEDRFVFRQDIFGSANYVGLFAGLILLVLLVLSNDVSLEWLKAKHWKNLQRLNYMLFLLIVIHGILYQIIEKRTATIVLIFVIIMLIPLVGQSTGFFITKESAKKR